MLFLVCAQHIFREPVTRAHVIIHTIDFLELRNTLERFLAKRSLALKNMQGNPFEQITKSYVEIFCESFEHLYHFLFHPDADLYALNGDVAIFRVECSSSLAI